MTAVPGFVLACRHCGAVPASDVEMGDVQVHAVVEHGTTQVEMELCWYGPGTCPDPRWVQCVEPDCYRGAKVDGSPHDGDHWMKPIRRQDR